MRINLVFVIFITCIIGCKESSKKIYYELLNENFLQFTDTIAYRTGHLIQIPNDTSTGFKFGNLCIEVDTSSDMPAELFSSIQDILRSEKITDFEKFLLGGADLSIDKIEITRIKKTGRYSLHTAEQINTNRCSKVVGKIKFYCPFVSKDMAIITLTISDLLKAGYTNMYLFNKHSGVWKNSKVFEIERW